MKLLPPEINFRGWKFCHVSRIIIFEDDEILIISRELIFAFAWYMFLPCMIIEGENRSLQNYQRCTNGIIRNYWVKNEIFITETVLKKALTKIRRRFIFVDKIRKIFGDEFSQIC